MVNKRELFPANLPIIWTVINNGLPTSTTIRYELPRTSHVNLSVYDMLGREVSALVNDRREAGVHKVQFDGKNLSSGDYFCRIQAGTFVETKRLLLLR